MTHNELVAQALEIIEDRQVFGEAVDKQSVVTEMIEDLDEDQSNAALLDAVEKAVTEAMS